MEVDQDIPKQGTPPGTPFEEGFTLFADRGKTSADPTRGVYTENYYTPLYDESQVSDRSNINTNRQHPSPIRTRNEAIKDAELAAAATAATTNQHPPTQRTHITRTMWLLRRMRRQPEQQR